MKKDIKVFLTATIAFGALVSTVGAHSLYCTFNIKPFAAPTTSTYSKTDGNIRVGINLNTPPSGQITDTINYSFATNGSTFYTVNVLERRSAYTNCYNFSSTVDVTFKDSKYNVGIHQVHGTLSW